MILDRFASIWKVLLTSDSHLRQNRKWKYGGNHIVELATIDFLFDLNTMYGSIGHGFDAGNYFLSVKSKVLKFHVHSVHKRFCIGSTGPHRQTGVVERITTAVMTDTRTRTDTQTWTERINTRHTDVIECITNIDTQTWSNTLHVLILLFYVADGSILSFYVDDVFILLLSYYSY